MCLWHKVKWKKNKYYKPNFGRIHAETFPVTINKIGLKENLYSIYTFVFYNKHKWHM